MTEARIASIDTFPPYTKDGRAGAAWWSGMSHPARLAHLVLTRFETGTPEPTPAECWEAHKRRPAVQADPFGDLWDAAADEMPF